MNYEVIVVEDEAPIQKLSNLQQRKPNMRQTVLNFSQHQSKTPPLPSSFVACPICNKSVFHLSIDFHLEEHEQQKTSTPNSPRREQEELSIPVDVSKQSQVEEFLLLHTGSTKCCWSWEWNLTPQSTFRQKKLSEIMTSSSSSPKANENNAFKHQANTPHHVAIDTYAPKQKDQIDIQTVESFEKQSLLDSGFKTRKCAASSDTRIMPSKQTSSLVSVKFDTTQAYFDLDQEPIAETVLPCKQVLEHETEWAGTLKINIPLPIGISHQINLHTSIPKVLGLTNWKQCNRSTFCSPSLLKSLLQKNVRLCRPESAVRVAKELILLSFNEFIRRISVIMIEDAILHPGLPMIMWLTMAHSKGFIPTNYHINLCLNIVHELSAVEWREVLGSNDEQLPSGSFHIAELKHLQPVEATLIKSILARAAFGGMKGDILMLCKVSHLWLHRFSSYNVSSPPLLPELTVQQLNGLPYLDPSICPSSCSNWFRFLTNAFKKATPARSYDFVSVGPVTKDDLVLSAVDHHCSPIVDQLLTQSPMAAICEQHVKHIFGHQQVEHIQEHVKNLVWIFRSSTNVKQTVCREKHKEEEQNREKLKDLWQTVRGTLDHLSYNILKHKLVKL